MSTCSWHGCSNTCSKGPGGKDAKYCSSKCRSKAGVDRFRRNLKRKAIEYKGGECSFCGYDKSQTALCFHHPDPKEKDFSLGNNGLTRKWDDIKPELDKCILLCLNCHAEVHAGWEEQKRN